MSNLKKSLVCITVLTLALTLGRVLIGQVYGPKPLAQGRFHQVAHKGEGIATITRAHGDGYVLRLTNFRTSDVSGLVIVLISAPDAHENSSVMNSRILNVGPLQRSDGDQEYQLPNDFDLQLYGAVTIWNPKYEVNFTTAPLQRF